MPARGLISFEVKLHGPLDIAASVERFRRWGDDLIDLWYGGTMVRALHLADVRGGTGNGPRVEGRGKTEGHVHGRERQRRIDHKPGGDTRSPACGDRLLRFIRHWQSTLFC